jgi:HK97 family phage major capsid protein
MSEITKTLDSIATAFEEYKQTNDQRIEAIKAGKGTAELDGKLARMDTAIDSMSEVKTKLEQMETRMNRPGAFGDSSQSTSREAAEYKGAFLNWMRAPADQERQQKVTQAQKALETRAADARTTVGASGGFALPEEIERAIAAIGLDISPIRSLATVRTVGSPDYKELIDINGAAFEWLGETDARNQTNTDDLAEVAPTFGMASAKPQATEESLDDLFFDVENWLIQSASLAIYAGEGAAFVSGNGTKKPTGFLAGPTPLSTADSSRAFGTLQYIAGGQAAAMPTSPDTFFDMIYSLRARYRANATWVTSKAVLASIRKYKEATTNAYMWQPALAAGQPSSFAGFPMVEAEDMPAVGANTFPVAFGDFKEGYLIADRVGMRMTRDEITTPGYVKFYIRKRVGGRLRNTQAIKLLKISTT